jgi:hypothetical protein
VAAAEVDAVLARLVAQFASPYDFLRELAQNSLDAGSDRVEVTLEQHVESGEVVFELVVVDTGSGMDETIIDGAFTRLFSSTKSDDRTMAGGFGVGFVSVFAWNPDVVLVQTGRAGEAWELVFYPDRTFEKHRVEDPFEGTTITLLKRAPEAEYEATAEAIRDSLWRWCRFCPVEVTFEELVGGEGPELIHDSPTTTGAVCSVAVTTGAERMQVAFAIPPRAVLLRRGLVLEESTPARAFERLAEGTTEHLQVWVDSPELSTTIAREGAVQDAGRAGVAARLDAAVGTLRGRLLEELGRLASGGAWTRREAGRYGALHGHLAMERQAMGPAWLDASLLRAADYRGEPIGGMRAWSVRELNERLKGRPILWTSHDEHADDAMARALKARLPVLAVEGEPDEDWLRALAEDLQVDVRRVSDSVVARGAELDDPRAAPLAAMTGRLLSLVDRPVRVSICERLGSGDEPPLVAEALPGGSALVGDGGVGRDVRALCLDRRHLLVQAALRLHGASRMPAEVATALAIAVAARQSRPPLPETLRQGLEMLIEEGVA